MSGAPPPLSRRIREERERLGITQEEAARRLHLSLGGYTAYERYREPKAARARQIALSFGLPEDHFETRTGDPMDLDLEEQLALLREELAEVRGMVVRLLREREETEPDVAGTRHPAS